MHLGRLSRHPAPNLVYAVDPVAVAILFLFEFAVAAPPLDLSIYQRTKFPPFVPLHFVRLKPLIWEIEIEYSDFSLDRFNTFGLAFGSHLFS